MQNFKVEEKTRKRFEGDMIELCGKLSSILKRAASSLFSLIREHGAHGAAIILIQYPHISGVFVFLQKNKLLDLSIEVLVLEYADTGMFDPELLSTCSRRLSGAGYSIMPALPIMHAAA